MSSEYIAHKEILEKIDKVEKKLGLKIQGNAQRIEDLKKKVEKNTQGIKDLKVEVKNNTKSIRHLYSLTYGIAKDVQILKERTELLPKVYDNMDIIVGEIRQDREERAIMFGRIDNHEVRINKLEKAV
jgi:archaellum component FlaC